LYFLTLRWHADLNELLAKKCAHSFSYVSIVSQAVRSKMRVR